MDGAYFRVHHFARQLASPFPLLAAIGTKTRRIEIGTAVIDMRYENPHHMAEDAGAADLISGGRLQLGVSRGSPEQVIDGWRYFGHQPMEGEDDEGMGRRRAGRPRWPATCVRRWPVGFSGGPMGGDAPRSSGPGERSDSSPGRSKLQLG